MVLTKSRSMQMFQNGMACSCSEMAIPTSGQICRVADKRAVENRGRIGTEGMPGNRIDIRNGSFSAGRPNLWTSHH